jgi:hypothetical protein
MLEFKHEEEIIMPFADPVLRELDDIRNLGAIRSAIIRTIRLQLEYRRGALDEWETVHFTNAVSSLALNVNSLQQPTTAWLRLCLVDLETALLLPADRFGPWEIRTADCKFLSYEELLDALDKIAERIAQIDGTPAGVTEHA